MKTSTQLALLFGHSQHGQIKLAESASFLYTERGIPSYDSIILVTEYKKTFFFHFCILSVRFSSRDLCHFKRQFLFSILVLFLVFIFHKWDKDVVFEHCGLLREREKKKRRRRPCGESRRGDKASPPYTPWWIVPIHQRQIDYNPHLVPSTLSWRYPH